MDEVQDLVHSLHHLRVFEVAARHRSFTRAAEELNVSQPAVSLAVRQLEQALGVRLFARGHRSVSLTQAGEMLFADVSAGLGLILETARLLRRQGRQSHVTLSVSTAFANYWMVPRLADFHHQHPGIDLRLQTTDKDLDLTQEGVTLGVRRGDGNWRGYAAAKIAEEELIAVASPRSPAARAEIATLDDLAAQQLIHLEEPFRPRPGWREWFTALSGEYSDRGGGLRLNDYALVLQAAMAGEGIALGWRHVTAGLLRQDLLVQVGPWCWQTGAAFHLIWSREAELPAQAEAVRDWIIETAQPD
ncbi:LysR substrate-binding domain-containing protein [Pelagibius sp.]|uniref:LysR substrate-binding domain-containing protein n=1 Tax=Pelagibius sp. TaxID=1931238 RepID=UPI003B51283B